MSTPIRIKRSSQPGKRPTTEQLQLGELAFNFNDGHLYSKRDTAGVGIGTTTALLTPWLENFGGASIYYDNSVGIGSTQPTSKLDVDGDVYISSNLVADGTISFAGISTFNSDVDINASVDISNDLVVNGNLSIVGLSTFASDIDINASIDVDGHTELDDLNVSGVSTFASAVDINADLDVDGRTELDITNISETLNVVGLSTFGSDVDINAGLDVDGHTELDDVNVSGASTFVGAADFNGGLTANQATVEDISNNNVVIAGTGGRLEGDSNLTFDGSTLSVGVDLDVDGHTELDQLRVVGVSTFAGDVDISAGGNLTVAGNLTVNGTQTILNTTQLEVEDINIGIASANPKLSNAALDGAGITIHGADGDKTLTWNNADSRMEFNTDLHAPNISSTDLTLTGDLDVDGHTELDNVNISGVTTFASSADFNADIDVDGHTELDNLNVSGVSTFSGAADFNGDLDVDGRTELDITNISETLNVTGVSTFASDVDINAGLDVDGRTELDITNISETLNVVGVSTFGSDVDINANVDISGYLDVDGHTELDNVNISGVSTFAGAIDANGDLDVDGRTELDITNISETLNVVGISTFESDIDINASIDVDGHTELDDLNVSGVSTFASTVDINADLDVDGRTELDITNISETLNVVGVSTFGSDIDINASIDVDGHTELDNLNVSGVSTFAGAADFNGGVDVLGHTELDTLNVSVATTSASLTLANAGVAVTAILDEDGLTSDRADALATQQSIKAYVDAQVTAQDLDFAADTGTGAVDLDSQTFSVFGTPNEIETAAAGQSVTIGLPSNVTITNQLDVGGGLAVTGITTLSSDVDVNASIDVDGHTELDDLNVSGVSTFAGAIDANGDLDVDGHTELDDLNVSGVSTFAGAIDANGDLDVDGFTELDATNISETLNVVGVATFASDIDINASIDVDGHTELDDLNVSGVSTFAGAADFNGDIDVDGHTELDDLNVSGVATFAQDVEIGGNLTVNGTQTILNTSQLEVEDINIGIASADPKLSNAALDGAGITIYGAAGDKTLTWSNADSRMEFNTDLFAPNLESTNLTLNGGLSVTGVSTFTGNIDANGDLDVDGHTELDNLNVSGVSTFAGAADFNGGVDVLGHTELDTLNVSVATTTASLTLSNAGVAVTAILDEDGLTSNRDDALATQQSIKAYVDAQVTAQDLDFSGDTGTGAVDLDSQTFSISGTFNEIETSASGQTISIGLPNSVTITDLTVAGGISITGVSTFTGAADFNGDVDIDGFTELDSTNISETLNVVGVSTFGSDVDINASIDVSGHTELDTLNVSVATTTASLTLANAGIAVTAILDEDGLTSDRADALATQQSIKAYVDAQVTAQDLDFAGDTGTGAVDLDSQSLTISGTANEIETSATGQTLTVGLPNEVAITTSLTVGSATTITGSGIIAGIVTGTLDNTLTLATSGTGLSGSATYDNSGASTFTVTSNATDANTGGTIVARDGSGNFSAGTISADLTGVASTATKLETARDFSVSGDVATSSGVSFDGTGNVDLAVTLSNTFSANTSGIITSSGGFVGDLTGVASTATKLETARDFSIIGSFVTASAVSFDGTGNVALGATITPDSITLGTYTSGDYVESITGTTNEIEVTGGSGEGSTPQIGLPDDVIIGQDLTVNRDVQINRDLNVTGNITIGGTSGTLFTETLQVADADLVLGIRTDAFGNDVSTDTTANHGGIAIASTEGNSLVNLNIVGIETLSPTYKKIMWFKAGSFSGLGTDAWLSNYAVGIGSTQFPTGTRLAAGSVQFTENDLAVVRNINASGIITGTLDNTLTLATSGNGLSGSATYDNSGAATFTVTSDATSANTADTIVYRDASGDFSAGTITANLSGNVTGDLTGVASTATKLETARDFSVSGDVATSSPVSFDGTGNVDLAVTLSNTFSANTSGIITSSGGFVGNLTGTATTATNLADGANITTGTISDDRLPDLITSNINITTGVSTVGTLDVVSVVADSLSVSGVSTFSDDVSIADKIVHTGDTDTAIRFPAADTFTVETAGGERVRVDSSGNVGVGTNNPTQLLDVNGDIRLRGAIFDSLNSTGTTNQVLVSNAGAGVTWKTLSDIPVGDANTLDGLDSTQFLRSDVDDTKSGITTFSDDVILQSNLNVSGVTTASSFVKSGGTSSEFLKADGTVDSNTYLTSYTETQTLDDVLTLGNVSGIGISVGVATASSFVKSGGTSSEFLKADGTVDSNTYLTAESDTLDDVTSRGNSTSNGISVGVATASSFVKSGGTSSQFLKADGSVDSNTYLTAESQTLDGILTLGNTSALGMSVGVVTATSFVKSGGTSSQFLKADGTVDSSTYLTSYTETQTIGDVLALGNVTGIGMSVGVVTATAFVGDGSGITNLPASTIGINTNTTNLAQLIPFAVSYGSTTGLGATDGLVYNPSSGRMGIGSDAPAYTLDVAGDINSSTDVKINGTGVLDTALALAIALG